MQTRRRRSTLGRGSCRDSAWLLVQLLRHLGLAARFVSGYLIQLAADVKPLDGPRGPERDFTDLHAWSEVYLPGAGWIGLDPTSGLLAGEGHIPLACTPEPASAAPITGAVDECEVDVRASRCRVQRVTSRRASPSRTPTTQWQAIDALGRAVDRELRRRRRAADDGRRADVRVDRRPRRRRVEHRGARPDQARLAAELLWRLRQHFAPRGFVHFGQGKWYPGEQLPRWALGCYWRARRRAGLAATPRSFADERADLRLRARRRRALPARARRAARRVRTRTCAGYEDVWYYLWRERRLPVNVDPLDARLDDELERERLRRVFAQGSSVVGYALPLRAARAVSAHGGRARGSCATSACTCMPGDSPMGYRLPLDSLPWVERRSTIRICASSIRWSTAPRLRIVQSAPR